MNITGQSGKKEKSAFISKLNLFKVKKAHAADMVNMKSIATIESTNNPKAINEETQAYGLHQVRQPALDDWNKDHPKEQYKLKTDMLNATINTKVATWYMIEKIPTVLGNWKIPDTQDHRLISYNWGLGNFKTWYKAGADKNKLPKETRGYLEKYKNLNP